MSEGKRASKRTSKRALFLLPLLILGCISGGGEQVEYSSEGLDILFFAPDIESAISEQEFSIRAQVQNKGESEAENVVLRFFKTGGFNAIELGSVQPDTSKAVGTLSKPDPAANLPGGMSEKTWRMAAPRVTGRNEKVTQEIGMVASYNYSSRARLELPVLPEETYLQYKQKNSLPTKVVDSSVAPLKLDYKSPDFVFGEDTFTIDLIVTKVGTGYVGEDSGELREVRIDFNPNIVQVVDDDRDGKADDCDFLNFDNDAGFVSEADAKMWTTGETKFSCEFEILPSLRSDEHYPIFQALVSYQFNTERTFSMSITGKRYYSDIDAVSFEPTDKYSSYTDSTNKIAYINGDTTSLSIYVDGAISTASAKKEAFASIKGEKSSTGQIPLATVSGKQYSWTYNLGDWAGLEKNTLLKVVGSIESTPLENKNKMPSQMTTSFATSEYQLYVDTISPVFDLESSDDFTIWQMPMDGTREIYLPIIEEGSGLAPVGIFLGGSGSGGLLESAEDVDFDEEENTLTLRTHDCGSCAHGTGHTITLDVTDNVGNTPATQDIIVKVDRSQYPVIKPDSTLLSDDANTTVKLTVVNASGNPAGHGITVYLRAVKDDGTEDGTECSGNCIRKNATDGTSRNWCETGADSACNLLFHAPSGEANVKYWLQATINEGIKNGDAPWISPPILEPTLGGGPKDCADPVLITVGSKPSGEPCEGNDQCSSGICFDYSSSSSAFDAGTYNLQRICVESSECAWAESGGDALRYRAVTGARCDKDLKAMYTCSLDPNYPSGGAQNTMWTKTTCPDGCDKDTGRCAAAAEEEEEEEVYEFGLVGEFNAGGKAGRDIAAEDFNWDGSDDIFILGKDGETYYDDVKVVGIKTWMDNGGDDDSDVSAPLGWTDIYSGEVNYNALAAGDFDGDGKIDIAVLDGGNEHKEIRVLDRTNSKTAQFALDCRDGRDIAAGDFSKDSNTKKSQIFVLARTGPDDGSKSHYDDVKVIGINNWMENWRAGDEDDKYVSDSLAWRDACDTEANLCSRSYQALAAGDFDGDGNTDIAISYNDGQDIRVYDGSSEYWAQFDVGGENLRDISAGDFDGDGVDDIFILGRTDGDYDDVKVVNIQTWMDKGKAADSDVEDLLPWFDSLGNKNYEALAAGNFDGKSGDDIALLADNNDIRVLGHIKKTG